ncbi:DUF4159 domain-containing protein [Candidatus Omnitrophota bacterium]
MTGDTFGRSRRPTDIIDLEKLETETQRLLFVGLMFAFIIYPVIGSYFMFNKNDKRVAQSYSISFVFRAAKLTKPFDLKPPSVLQRLQRKHQFPGLHPDFDLKPNTDLTVDVKDKYDILDIDMEIISSVGNIPTETEQETESFQPLAIKKQISMIKELLSVEDLDIGQFKAMVVQKPSKKDIHGFVYISSTWGSQLRVPDKLKPSIIHLAEAVNRYTNIEANVSPHLLLNSHELMTMPFIYIATDTAFELTPFERQNLGAYLRAGGFAIIDNGDPVQEHSQAESSLRQMIRDTLGKGVKFAPIPNDHPLYHSYFDFNDGPPLGSEVEMVETTTSGYHGEKARNSVMSKAVYYLEGIWIEDRLAVVYSNKGYGCKWKDFENNDPQLRMGVNMVVYALTQEGGISQKVMSRYSTNR